MLKSPPFDTHRRRRKTTQANYGERHSRAVHPIAWAILAVVIVAIVSFFALIAIRGYPAAPMTTYNGYPFFGGWFFFPFGIIFFFLFLFLVTRFVFWGWWGWGWRRRYWYGYEYGDAHEILRQRYARGEITKEQFDQMTRDLEQHQ